MNRKYWLKVSSIRSPSGSIVPVEPPLVVLLDRPDRLPRDGDMYEATRAIFTLANESFYKGDRVLIRGRNHDQSFGRTTELGHVLVESTIGTTNWSSFDELVAHGDFVLVTK